MRASIRPGLVLKARSETWSGDMCGGSLYCARNASYLLRLSSSSSSLLLLLLYVVVLISVSTSFGVEGASSGRLDQKQHEDHLILQEHHQQSSELLFFPWRGRIEFEREWASTRLFERDPQDSSNLKHIFCFVVWKGYRVY